MKGYMIPQQAYAPVTEPTLVGCRHCRATWHEDVHHESAVRINGASYRYDACDSCYNAEEKRFYRPDEVLEVVSRETARPSTD